MRQNIYPTTIFRRRRESGPVTPPGGDTVNEANIYKALLHSVTNMKESITMSDAAGTVAKNKTIAINPVKLCYIEDGTLTNRQLYCIYKWAFPKISEGDSITWTLMSNISLGQLLFVGNEQPHATGKIDVYAKGSLGTWRTEESGGIINYYNYTEDFEEQKYGILYPEHIPVSVLYEMMPNYMWRSTNNHGIGFTIATYIAGIPTGIRPFTISDKADSLKYIQTFTPAYASGKVVNIYVMLPLLKMPKPV